MPKKISMAALVKKIKLVTWRIYMGVMRIQEALFEILEENYDSRKELVQDLCRLLHVRKDSVYRRLRGDTALTADELGVICQRYAISLDAIIQDAPSRMFFEFSAFKKPVKSVEEYVQQLDANFKKVRSIPEGHIFYATSEIPVFYYAFFPRLFLFKLYVWGKTIWDISAFQELKFSFDIMPYGTNKDAAELIAGYCQMDTTELWSLNIADNTLNQIFYHADINSFENIEDALLLCDDMDKLLNHLEELCEQEKKRVPGTSSGQGDLRVLHNEMIYTNNTIYFKSPSLRSLYTTLANPNFIVTMNKKLCDYKEHWFQKLMSKSTKLSGPEEKRRSKFFTTLHKTVDRTRKKIELLAD
jgi:hypothetical protein